MILIRRKHTSKICIQKISSIYCNITFYLWYLTFLDSWLMLFLLGTDVWHRRELINLNGFGYDSRTQSFSRLQVSFMLPELSVSVCTGDQTGGRKESHVHAESEYLQIRERVISIWSHKCAGTFKDNNRKIILNLYKFRLNFPCGDIE